MAAHFIGPYQFTRFIAMGTSGAVWECRHQQTGELVACKVVELNQLADQQFWQHLRNELIIHSQIRHSGITQLKDVLLDQGHLYVFIELCHGGDLGEVVAQSGGLPEDRARHYFRHIMNAVSYIHELGVAHRDIKLENILVTSDDEAKLTDFGLCKQQTDDAPMFTACGTIVYAAPEIISQKPYDGMKADVWSAGVLLYSMVSNHFPWVTDSALPAERQFADAVRQITEGDIVPPSGSWELQELIGSMLTVDPDERPSASDVLQHPWMGSDQEDGGGIAGDPDPRIVQLVKEVIGHLEKLVGG